jgi:hypothetical protein
MNGRDILIGIIAINLIMLFAAISMRDAGNTNFQQNNIILNLFFDDDQLLAENLTKNTPVNLDNTFSDTIGNMTDAQTGGFTPGLSSFIDGIKMILGMLILLTPIPIFTFMFAFGAPLVISLLVFAIPFILYVLAIMGFLRGKDF